MSLLRKSTVNQIDKIEKEIKKQGGKLDLTVPSDHTSANGMWMHDPFDASRKGKRKIATIDDHMKIDIPNESKIVKFADFKTNENKKINDNMKTIKNFEDYKKINEENLFLKNDTEELHSGQCVELISMDDEHAVKPGTFGIIKHIDDMGNISVKWETGSTLALVPEADEYRILSDEECKTNPNFQRF